MVEVNSLIHMVIVVSVVVGILLLGSAIDSRRIARKMNKAVDDAYELRMLRAEYIDNKEKGQ